MRILRSNNVRAFENAGVTQERLAIGTFDHYSVQGEPGTWRDFANLDDAIAYARSLGVRCVRGTRYLERGPYVAAVWVEGAS